jgi:hypothetical protein
VKCHALYLLRAFVASRVEKECRETHTHTITSSASGTSTEDDDTDDDTHTVIGRRGSVSAEPRNCGADANRKSPRAPSPLLPASSSDGSKVNGRTSTLSRRPFTRSRSPVPGTLGLNGIAPQPRPPSPTVFLRPRSVGSTGVILPGTFSVTISIWMTSWQYRFCIDAKHAAEGVILVFALAFAAQKLWSPSSTSSPNDWPPIGTFIFCSDASRVNHIYTLELFAVIFVSLAHMAWNHSSCTRVTPLASKVDPGSTEPPPTPRLPESRAPRRGALAPTIGPLTHENRGYVWMTVPKNYRSSLQVHHLWHFN